MPSFQTTVFHIFAILSALLSFMTAVSASSSCDCWKTADTNLLFLNYVSTNFTGLDSEAWTSPKAPGMPGPYGTEGVTAPYFNTSAWYNSWSIESWSIPVDEATDGATVDYVNSQQNVYIARDTSSSPTHLTLRTCRLSNYQSTAEIDSIAANILYGSFRFHTRIRGATGACAGFCTYHSDTQEADIEVLTRDPTDQFHASNHGVVPESSSVVPVPSTVYGWNDWRMDWQKGQTSYSFNGKWVSKKQIGVPNAGSNWVMNIWSDGGEWTGNMTMNTCAYADLGWVSYAYNTTRDGGRSCKKVCSI